MNKMTGMKITPEQITGLILRIKTKYIALRIGQIISNAVRIHTHGVPIPDPYFISDNDLYNALKTFEAMLDLPISN